MTLLLFLSFLFESFCVLDGVCAAIDTADEAILKKLHSLMFGCPGKKETVRKSIRQFKGIPLNEQHVWREQMKVLLFFFR